MKHSCHATLTANLEVQRYPPRCAAAWVLSLQSLIKLGQLLSLAFCQIASCIWQQPHCAPESMMVLVVVWVELKHMPACRISFNRHTKGFASKEKKRKGYSFRRQVNEKPSMILGCPGKAFATSSCARDSFCNICAFCISSPWLPLYIWSLIATSESACP